ncbi:MAG: HigA family addiction module antitoxin [Paraclostridium sp.]
MINKSDKYFANIAIPPGETLEETLECLNMSQKEFASRVGMAIKTINEIIKGKAPITADTALKFETVLDIPASFWMNLESNYREALARIKAEEAITIDYEIVKEMPYTDMSRKGWVPATSKKNEKVIHSRYFFNVAQLTSVSNTICGRFRKSEGKNVSMYAVSAWLRKGQIDASNISTSDINKKKLKDSIPYMRTLTLKPIEEAYEELKQICKENGVILLITDLIPKTSIDGATQWISPEKALIQLSLRGKRVDGFWFTFFHELAHVIYHSKKEIHINFYGDDKQMDKEADDIAKEWLIPTSEYDRFVRESDELSNQKIVKFAQEVGIDPCIVVGRLQKDKHIEFNEYSNFIKYCNNIA